MLVSWISCNVLFQHFLRDHSGGIFLGMNVSGDVCDEVVSHILMSKSAQDVQTSSWWQRLCVLSGVQSESKFKLCSSGRDAGHRCFSSGNADCVELVSRSHEADGVLVKTKLWTEQCLLWARFSLIP